jgi:hypothetical protein
MSNIPDEILDKIKAEFPDKTGENSVRTELYNAIQKGHRNNAELGYGLALPEMGILKTTVERLAGEKRKFKEEIATLEKTIEDQDKLRIQDGLEIERLKGLVENVASLAWDEGNKSAYDCVQPQGPCDFNTEKNTQNKETYLSNLLTNDKK